jgi:hypothetical protein
VVKKLLFLLLLLLVAYLLWLWWWRSAHAVGRGQELVYDRLWVDHLPTGETDAFKVFAAVTEQPLGLFQSASVWTGEYELFRYEPRGDGLMIILYPQSRQKEQVSYRATRCQERSFDFCLEVSGASRGARRYYSQKGWEIGARSLAAVEARVAALGGAPLALPARP